MSAILSADESPQTSMLWVLCRLDQTGFPGDSSGLCVLLPVSWNLYSFLSESISGTKKKKTKPKKHITFLQVQPCRHTHTDHEIDQINYVRLADKGGEATQLLYHIVQTEPSMRQRIRPVVLCGDCNEN